MTPFEITLTVLVLTLMAFFFFTIWWNQRHPDDDKPDGHDSSRI